MIGRFLYQLSILLLIAGVHIAALFHPKSAKWVKGRRNWRKRLKDELDTKRKSDRPTVWMHASSLGEYEQGRPILEGLQADHPGLNIILSFFSPSGYEVARYHDLATIVCYLPADTPQAARDMVTIIKPDLVLWMKYEYWYNHLKAIDEQRIPVLLVSAIFQSRQPFFKWYGGWYRQMLGYFTHLFVQDNWSVELVKRYVDTDRITQNGDTRFDRVLGIANSWQRIPELETWLAGAEQVAVAGSTWPDDDKVLRHLVNTRGTTRWIIAPHHTEKGPIEAVAGKFDKVLLFSQLKDSLFTIDPTENAVLIIDSIGQLSRIYKYATICFVGGGFSATGIHNVLEPAVYGKPVLFGPEYEEYAEAIGLVACGGGIVVANALDLEAKFHQLLSDKDVYEKAARSAAEFVNDNAGATRRVIEFIYKNRLLTRL